MYPTILFAGIKDAGTQAGGWTIEWQGVTGDLLGATTIFQGIQRAAGSNTQVLYDARGVFANFDGTAPVGIAVVGELPYAEGVADLSKFAALRDGYRADQQFAPQGGETDRRHYFRPAAYHYGPVPDRGCLGGGLAAGLGGQGVADVLMGDYPFTGKTPYTWPCSYEQLPINENNVGREDGLRCAVVPLRLWIGGGRQSTDRVDRVPVKGKE